MGTHPICDTCPFGDENGPYDLTQRVRGELVKASIHFPWTIFFGTAATVVGFVVGAVFF